MIRRRIAIDFDQAKPLVFSRLLQASERKTRWHSRTDETIVAAFNQVYPMVEEMSADEDLARRMPQESDLPEMGDRWNRRTKRRFADSWAIKEAAVDPLTAWVIYQVVMILIRLWWERRKEKLGS